MKNKFTQWEWCVVKDSTYPTLHQIWNKTFQGNIPTYIARTCYAPNSEANAKLISAAPDLLDACESVLEWWNEHQYDTTYYGEYNLYDHEPKFVTKAKAAIKKATK